MIYLSKKQDYQFELDPNGRLWVGKGSPLDNPFLPGGSIPERYVHIIKEDVEYITPRQAAMLYRKYAMPCIREFIGKTNFKLCLAATDYICFCNEAGYCHANLLKSFFNNHQLYDIPYKPLSKPLLETIKRYRNWSIRTQFIPTRHNKR